MSNPSGRWRLGAVAALAFLVSGCAGLETRPPEISAQAEQAERIAQQKAAVEHYLALVQRVDALAWPLLRGNAELCRHKMEPALGMRLMDGPSLAATLKLRAKDMAQIGWGSAPQVATLAPEGPAAQAGLLPGDQIVAIAGKAVPTHSSLKDVTSYWAQALRQSTADLSLQVRRSNGQEESITVKAQITCQLPIRVIPADAVNASTNGRVMTVNASLVRTLTDDRQVQMVLAHELAHAVLRHPRKAVMNSLVSGGAVLGTAASTLGSLADTGLRFLGIRTPRPLGRMGAELATYPYGRDFEREADYVGVYMLARAHIDLTGIEDLFMTFANRAPVSTWLNLSHPVTPTRRLALQAAREEVLRKQALHQPLFPEGWSSVSSSAEGK